ncbi:hypothetical protein HN51_045248 [Arachis hypogaea]
MQLKSVQLEGLAYAFCTSIEDPNHDSGLWVLQWLSMRENFNPTVLGIINEQYIRTSVAVDLLLGMCNDHKYDFQKKSNDFWATL